jgi:multidrug efflux pump subunit AcrA (membrane-fusion protein)
VLAQLGELLDRFEAAVALANDGRTQHKGATRQLDGLATELALVVRTMDARNRQRFQENRQLLALWISASTVLGTKREVGVPAEVPAPGSEPVIPETGAEPGGTPVVEGDVRPVA